jgi:hypothetical protein
VASTATRAHYVSSAPDADGRPARTFRFALVAPDVGADDDRAFSDFPLAADNNDAGHTLPPDALFDDLALIGLVFPLDPAAVGCAARRSLRVVDMRDISVDSARTRVVLRTLPSACSGSAPL